MEKPSKHLVKSLEETQHLARTLADELKSMPCIILLQGEMGSGKTTFSSAFIRALSSDKSLRVTSPTYALANTYMTTPPVHHLDLYRLIEGQKLDLESMGIWHLIEDTRAFRLIEWPEPIEALLDKKSKILRVTLHDDANNKAARHIHIEEIS